MEYLERCNWSRGPGSGNAKYEARRQTEAHFDQLFYWLASRHAPPGASWAIPEDPVLMYACLLASLWAGTSAYDWLQRLPALIGDTADPLWVERRRRIEIVAADKDYRWHYTGTYATALEPTELRDFVALKQFLHALVEGHMPPPDPGPNVIAEILH